MKEMESVCLYSGCMSFQGAVLMSCRHVSTFMASGSNHTYTHVHISHFTADHDEEIHWRDVLGKTIRKMEKREQRAGEVLQQALSYQPHYQQFELQTLEVK